MVVVDEFALRHFSYEAGFTHETVTDDDHFPSVLSPVLHLCPLTLSCAVIYFSRQVDVKGSIMFTLLLQHFFVI